MAVSSKQAILKTLAYADIFDYPLTESELWRFLIGDRTIDKKSFEKEISSNPYVTKKGVFYVLSGREYIIDTRLKRREESVKKIAFAKRIAKHVRLIPTISFIGISGGLAMENASSGDDIDLFIITKKNSLWISRFLLVLLLEFLGVRRRRGASHVVNKICLNMFVTEERLCCLRQNLYTAHEVVQMKPIFEKNNMYKKFISENRWVQKFLPNSIDGVKNQESRIKKKNIEPPFVTHYSLLIIEWLAKTVQLWYMKRHRTRETIANTLLAFHPFNYESKVLREYYKRLKKYTV